MYKLLLDLSTCIYDLHQTYCCMFEIDVYVRKSEVYDSAASYHA